jgi:uncharacterized membrane protein YbhN (UPF0104 family)
MGERAQTTAEAVVMGGSLADVADGASDDRSAPTAAAGVSMLAAGLGHDPAPPAAAPPSGRMRISGRVATVAVLVALVGSLMLAVPSLRGVLTAIGDMSTAWVAGAVALELASCAAFVVVFRLFFERVPARPARQLAWTEMASGALLPGGGVGGLAIGGWLMHLGGMPMRRIVTRSSGLFFLTTAASAAALIGTAALLAAGLVPGPHDFLRAGLPGLVGAAATAFVLALPRIVGATPPAARSRSWGRHLVEGIREAERTLTRPSWRLLGAAGYLAFDIAVLWATFRAAGAAPAVGAIVLGYIIGYLANLLPVPAGVGVLDSGLAGTLILYGAPATKAAAAVFVYHAIAFWVPGLGGLAAYAPLRRRMVSRRAGERERLSPAPRAGEGERLSPAPRAADRLRRAPCQPDTRPRRRPAAGDELATGHPASAALAAAAAPSPCS